MTPTTGLVGQGGLQARAPLRWGEPIPSRGPGVYVIEGPSDLGTAPLSTPAAEAWLGRVPGIRVDGLQADARSLAMRLDAFWIHHEPVLYVGRAGTDVGSRVRARNHRRGARRPRLYSWCRSPVARSRTSSTRDERFAPISRRSRRPSAPGTSPAPHRRVTGGHRGRGRRLSIASSLTIEGEAQWNAAMRRLQDRAKSSRRAPSLIAWTAEGRPSERNEFPQFVRAHDIAR